MALLLTPHSSLLTLASTTGDPHEILLPDLVRAVPQQDPHLPDPAVGGGRVPAVRIAGLGARGLQQWRQRRRRRPPGGRLAPVDHADAALQPAAADPIHARRE